MGTADPVETTLLDQAAEHKKQVGAPAEPKHNKEALAVVKLDETDAHSSKPHPGAVEEAGELATQLQSAEANEAKKFVQVAANEEKQMIKNAQAADKKMESEAKNVILADVKKIKK